MEFLRRWLFQFLLASATYLLQRSIARWPGCPTWLRRIFPFMAAWMLVGPTLVLNSEFRVFPPVVSAWLLAATLSWFVVVLALAIYAWSRVRIPHDSERRIFLRGAGAAFAAAPFVGVAVAVVGARVRPILQEVDIKIPGLPKDLQGIRIAQLTDIHFGPFFTETDLRRAVDIANEIKPHITVVTGDLITRRGDDLETCIRLLRPLKAEAGVFGCHGNHEAYAGVEDEAARLASRFGIRILRQETADLRFGQSTLRFTGYDYQRKSAPYLVGAESFLLPGALNVLLSHSPDVFRRAAHAGFQLTIAGHTHGGQVNLEILHEKLNIARVFTPYTYGLYTLPMASLFVSAGLGTVGAPLRIGAPPEVVAIRLCAA
jgi:hypothetical protein